MCWRNIASELDALLCSILFHLGWSWAKQGKYSRGKTLFVSLAKGRQCSRMWRLSRRAPDGVWTYSVLSEREWEEVVLGSVRHTGNLQAKVKVDGLFPLCPAHPAGFSMQWYVLCLTPINICLLGSEERSAPDAAGIALLPNFTWWIFLNLLCQKQHNDCLQATQSHKSMWSNHNLLTLHYMVVAWNVLKLWCQWKVN